MGRFTFNLPDIGEGIAEAEIVAFHVKPGDRVEEGQRVADMLTDKATVEMESPVAGEVIEVAGEVGDTIAIGSMLVVIDADGELPDAIQGNSEEPVEAAAASIMELVEDRPEIEASCASDANDMTQEGPKRARPGGETPGPVPAPRPAPAAEAQPASIKKNSDLKVLATPAVRQRAQDLGIPLSAVRPSEEGRIRHADLDAFISYDASGGYAPAGRARSDETIRLIGLRRRIAENMAAAKRNIPHFTYVEECDVTELEKVRAQLNAARGDRIRLTMLPLLISGICKTLPNFPMINARYNDEAGVVTRHGAIHLGVATQTDGGLMVPVINDAQTKNLWQLAGEIKRLAEAARDGSATSSELAGSTLTVTSLGALGGVATTPVINRPEVAIIGPNRIVERPMFVPDGLGGERVEKRKMMNISISCDHRVVDGWDAASFMQHFKKLIETPALLLSGAPQCV